MKTDLKEMFKYELDNDKYSKLFYNMSATMKYIHDNDYYINNFSLDSIEIIDSDKLSPIKFDNLEKISFEDEDEVIINNIYLLALMQVGVYSNTLDYINPQFVKENFDAFETFIPQADVPYLKGVITRKSPVYYCDYVNERNKRDIEKMEKEVGSSGGYGMIKQKSTAAGRALADKDTKKMYREIDDRQAAFTTFLILPLVMILIGIVFSIAVMVLR